MSQFTFGSTRKHSVIPECIGFMALLTSGFIFTACSSSTVAALFKVFQLHDDRHRKLLNKLIDMSPKASKLSRSCQLSATRRAKRPKEDILMCVGDAWGISSGDRSAIGPMFLKKFKFIQRLEKNSKS